MRRAGRAARGGGARVSSRSCRAEVGRGQLRPSSSFPSSSCKGSSGVSSSASARSPPHLARAGLRSGPRPASRARRSLPRSGRPGGGPLRGAAAAAGRRAPLLAASLRERPGPASGEGARERGSASPGAICWLRGRRAGRARAARVPVPTSRRAERARGRRLQRPQIPQTRLLGSPFCLGLFSALSFLSPPCGMLSSHQRD